MPPDIEAVSVLLMLKVPFVAVISCFPVAVVLTEGAPYHGVGIVDDFVSPIPSSAVAVVPDCPYPELVTEAVSRNIWDGGGGSVGLEGLGFQVPVTVRLRVTLAWFV